MLRGSILSLDRSIDSELVLEKIPMEFSTGFEVILKKKLFFRIGMFQRGTLASGIGLSWNDFIIDYTFLNDGFVNGIEKNHLLSVSVSIERLKKYFSNISIVDWVMPACPPQIRGHIRKPGPKGLEHRIRRIHVSRGRCCKYAAVRHNFQRNLFQKTGACKVRGPWKSKTALIVVLLYPVRQRGG